MNPVIVFTNGCFDLFHAGHVDFLQRCRSLGDRLIVGINSDDSVRRLKGTSRPIVPQDERCRIVAACRFVDEVHLFDEPNPCELIRRLRPAVFAKGPGYTEASLPEAKVVQAYGGQVVLLHGPPISTTRLINRILSHGELTESALRPSQSS